MRALSTDAATILDGQQHRIGFVFSGRKGSQPVSYKRLREVLHSVCRLPASIRSPRTRFAPHSGHLGGLGGAEAHELREAFGWRTLAHDEPLCVQGGEPWKARGAARGRRHERLATAGRLGEGVRPVSVEQIGDVLFVRTDMEAIYDLRCRGNDRDLLIEIATILRRQAPAPNETFLRYLADQIDPRMMMTFIKPSSRLSKQKPGRSTRTTTCETSWKCTSTFFKNPK